MPVVSAAASWVEALKIPMRQIRKMYTKSDMVLQAWDSKQRSYNMSQSFQKNTGVSSDPNPSQVIEDGDSYVLPKEVNNGIPIPKKFFNKEGELDLRLATGEEACNYLRRLGVQIMPVFNS